MRAALLILPLLAACTTPENLSVNPLTWPGKIIGGGIRTAIYDQRRGQVELFVATNHPALLADITAGGGASLTQAMDIAGVPAQDRRTRITQLQGDQGLYQTSPAALVVALMVYGS